MCICTFFTQRLNFTTASDELHHIQITQNFFRSYYATVKLLSMRVNSTFRIHISLTMKKSAIFRIYRYNLAVSN